MSLKIWTVTCMSSPPVGVAINPITYVAAESAPKAVRVWRTWVRGCSSEVKPGDRTCWDWAGSVDVHVEVFDPTEPGVLC